MIEEICSRDELKRCNCIKPVNIVMIFVYEINGLKPDIVLVGLGTPKQDFWIDEHDCDVDYDIDLDFLPEYQQKLYMGLSEGMPFLERAQVTFGAARNG